jgi:hypothetical protein
MRDVIQAIRRGLARLRAQPPLRREIFILSAALLFAVLILPSLIWTAGQFFLGDYIRSPTGSPTGGPLALTLDLLGGVFSLSPGHWLVLLGPYLLLAGLRGGRALLKM